MSDAFAELFEFNPAGTPIPAPVADTFVPWVTGIVGVGGPDDLIVADAALAELRVEVNGKGVYFCFLTMSFSADVAQVNVEGAIFRNGIPLAGLRFMEKLGNFKDVASSSALGVVELVPGDTLTAHVAADKPNTTIELIDGSLGALAYPRSIT